MDSIGGSIEPPTTLGRQSQTWSQLSQQQWDIVIVGGGITGAGILREASRLGLSALLVEQQDFAWGTSSRSSKMVHGGLRYLGQGDYKLTRHSLQERERLLREAPGLVERMGYYFTMRKNNKLPGWAVKILLWLYDRMAGIRDHRRIPLQQLATTCEGIDTSQLKDCFYYTDAVTDDARLVLRVLQEAVADGGTALNYVRAEQLNTDAHQHITSVTLCDTTSGATQTVHAKAVINATGAWADALRNQINPETRVRPLRGSHLVVPQQRLPVTSAITLMHPDDQRAMFVFPWEHRTVIGTTDLDHTQPLNEEASITQEEVDYLLKAANDLFPKASLEEQDVISSWSGVRPVIGSDKSKDPSKERRDHAVWRDGNLITVSGGKLTTFRLIALDALQALSDIIAVPTPVHTEKLFRPSFSKPDHFPSIPENVFQHLHARHGVFLTGMLNNAHRTECVPLSGTQTTLAECRWILHNEAVTHLDDLMLRRTRLGQVLEVGGAEVLPQIKPLCMEILAWDESRWNDEVSRYQTLWQRHYALPSTTAQNETYASA